MTASGFERPTTGAVMVEMGEDLRKQPESRGLTQEQVAHSAEIAVHTYSSLERGLSPSGGVANPTIDTLRRVLHALGIRAPRVREFLSL